MCVLVLTAMMMLFVHNELYVLIDELLLVTWFLVSNMVNEPSCQTVLMLPRPSDLE